MRIDNKILGVKGFGILMSVQQPPADNFVYFHWLCTRKCKDFIHQGLLNSLQKNWNSLPYLNVRCKEHYPLDLNTPSAFFKPDYAMKQWIYMFVTSKEFRSWVICVAYATKGAKKFSQETTCRQQWPPYF